MRPRSAGGWDLPDVRLFCAAMGLARLFSNLRDNNHVSHNLAVFFAGTAIRDFGGRYDHSTPHSEVLPTFYRLMRAHAVRLRQHIPDTDFSTWTARQLYEALCDIAHPIPEPQRDRRHTTSRLLEGNRVDVLWQHAHDVLPVRFRLRRFHISRTDSCAVCGGRETHRHVFFECLNAGAMWRKVAAIYGLAQISYDTVHYLDPIPVPARKEPGFLLLCAEICFQLWCARTRAVYGASPATLLSLLLSCRIALRSRMQTELRVLGLEAFRRRWKSHHNVFVLVRGNVLVKF